MPSPADPLAALAPAFHQIGLVVPDIDRAAELFRKTYGVPRFFIFRDAAIAEQTYLGRPSDTRQHVGFAYAGIFNIELIQPLSGISTYSKFLEAHPGGGIHHLGLKVADFQQGLADLRARGYEVVQSGRNGADTRFAYFDTDRDLGFFTEIFHLDDEQESLFARIRANAF